MIECHRNHCSPLPPIAADTRTWLLAQLHIYHITSVAFLIVTWYNSTLQKEHIVSHHEPSSCLPGSWAVLLLSRSVSRRLETTSKCLLLVLHGLCWGIFEPFRLLWLCLPAVVSPRKLNMCLSWVITHCNLLQIGTSLGEVLFSS